MFEGLVEVEHIYFFTTFAVPFNLVKLVPIYSEELMSIARVGVNVLVDFQLTFVR